MPPPPLNEPSTYAVNTDENDFADLPPPPPNGPQPYAVNIGENDFANLPLPSPNVAPLPICEEYIDISSLYSPPPPPAAASATPALVDDQLDEAPLPG